MNWQKVKEGDIIELKAIMSPYAIKEIVVVKSQNWDESSNRRTIFGYLQGGSGEEFAFLESKHRFIRFIKKS